MKNLFGKKGMLLLLVYTYCLSGSMAVATDRSFPAQKVINRQFGDGLKNVIFKTIDPCEGKETFLIESSKGILTISGSSQVALCFAFRYYLKNVCGAMKTWCVEPLSLP